MREQYFGVVEIEMQENLEQATASHSTSSNSERVVDHLREVIASYLRRRPHLSVNGISKKCGVSEPTIRRIMSQKVKTTPQITTLLDILTFVSQSNSVREIVAMYPGPIGEFLAEAMPYLEEFDQDYSNAINEELKDPVKYLIYKLALNSCGVREAKIIELYGNHGLQLLDDMVEKGFIDRNEDQLCRARAKTFSGSHDEFVRNFKVVADFIKTNKLRNRKPLNPYFVNMSDSLNPEAYEQIRRILSKTDKKLRKILSSRESKGTIPFFFLGAMDTLDSKSAQEWVDDEEKGKKP